MKIAFYAPMKPPDHPVPSGDRRVARLLLAALRAGGHRVVLASRLRSWDDGRDEERRAARQAALKARGARIAERLVARWGGASDRPALWFTYHLYHKAPDWIGPPVSAALGIPYVVAEASYAAKRAEGPWAEGFAAAAAAIRQAATVFAMSAVDAEGLRPVIAQPSRLVRLPPFLDPAPFAAAAARRDAARTRWWGGDPGPWLIAVGMMRHGDKQRSYEVLAAALRRLDDLPWRIALVGFGPAEDAVLGLFEPARRRHVGAVAPDAMAELLAAADLMVWPAINEAYGMALLEGHAAGLPIVAGASGGVPEIVRDDITGLLTPPGDAVAFAAAVRTLLADPARRHAMGAAAARLAAEHHGFAAAAGRINAVLTAIGQ